MTTSDREYFDARFAQIDVQINQAKAEVKAELQAALVSTVKWCASIAATTILIFTTIVAFLMTNSIPRPQQASTPSAPTVIVVPQTAPSPSQLKR